MNMKSAKSGYSEITKLTVPNPTFNPDIPTTPQNSKTFIITDGDLIRQKNEKYLPRHLQTPRKSEKY